MQPSAPPPQTAEEVRLQRLFLVSQTYEISSQTVAHLRQLESFEIIVVCDDSGSMRELVKNNSSDAFAPQKTRWDELCHTVSIITEVAAALDKSGVDVYFLNRPPMLGVKSAAQIQGCFQMPPQGYTPIVRTLGQVLAVNAQRLAESKILLILATDGTPTDDQGNIKIPEFIDFVKAKPDHLYLSLVACTDDESSIEYMDKLIDQNIPRIDVTEEYRAEKEEVLKKKGSGFVFTFGDYVAKILLGPVDSRFGDKGLGLTGNNNGDCCCSII